MVKLGIVCFANYSGLGNQTRRLTQMLNPHRILVVDSTPFSKNKSQRFDWYDGFSGYRVYGFPQNKEIRVFLRGLTHVLVCENPLNFYLISESRRLGIKTYVQTNFEFCDNLNKPELPVPDMFLMPSYWKVDDMKRRFGDDKVCYLPPPIDPKEFEIARETNFKRIGKRHFLHIVGTLAAHDRNGTKDLLKALQLCQADFTLTIRSQHPLPEEYIVQDPRVRYCIENAYEAQDMYMDVDALIFPRRYGGLALTMNEAMMSGCPVLMTDISPNNEILPVDWVIPCVQKESFQARELIQTYSAVPYKLAEKIDELANANLDDMKTTAFEIAYNQFSHHALTERYNHLW